MEHSLFQQEGPRRDSGRAPTVTTRTYRGRPHSHISPVYSLRLVISAALARSSRCSRWPGSPGVRAVHTPVGPVANTAARPPNRLHGCAIDANRRASAKKIAVLS